MSSTRLADWLRAGNAIKTVDDFAAAHAGNAPVLVFVDSGGAFNNDTECVDGNRGNAADHLTKDVVPFMESTYGVSANPANWGIVGWSMGGTCAVDLTVMHPDMFSTFEDIAGDIAPNSGTKQQTIDRLFGGNAATYADFDPTTVITRHGPYTGVSGWFDISGTTPHHARQPTAVNAANNGGNGIGGRDPAGRTSGQTAAANSLCGLGDHQRDRLCRGGPGRQARLAVRRTCLRRGAALAGRPDRHSRGAAETAADAPAPARPRLQAAAQVMRRQ